MSLPKTSGELKYKVLQVVPEFLVLNIWSHMHEKLLMRYLPNMKWADPTKLLAMLSKPER